jgi:sugar/nucleoside kinase (ribokinase family)
LIPTGGGVLCAGNTVHDILARPVDRLQFDQTVWVDDIRTSLGGNGANTAYTLARLGVRVRLASIVGRDQHGNEALEILSGAGVDTSAVTRSDLPTPSTVVLVRGDGARAFFHRPGCVAEDFPIVLPGGWSHFHLGNVFALPRLRQRAGEIMARARAAGMTTSLDTGWDSRGEWAAVIDPALPHTDLLFVNHDEADRLSRGSGAEYFLKCGVTHVVTKLGAQGCSVRSAEDGFDVPGFAIHVVDTTGAGDCFAGGFLAALEHGLHIAEAARFANAVGALNVQHLGAISGLRSFEETLGWIRGQDYRAESAAKSQIPSSRT